MNVLTAIPTPTAFLIKSSLMPLKKFKVWKRSLNDNRCFINDLNPWFYTIGHFLRHPPQNTNP